ncbi:hypothetical protein [Burkholderia multivorans]|uniref:hypothetical protein n=1 Tax=Burkholderia multivorans TaxID=87883 RepID=UPI0018C8B298|nr:hypothetical protein [Burkholderia multivorans]
MARSSLSGAYRPLRAMHRIVAPLRRGIARSCGLARIEEAADARCAQPGGKTREEMRDLPLQAPQIATQIHVEEKIAHRWLLISEGPARKPNRTTRSSSSVASMAADTQIETRSA